jgi:eukaryotic-like serine/threonine-protein kinase
VTLRRIGPYEVEGLLGEGGIGRVYVARDTVLGRQVAIKALRPEMSHDSNLIERFFSEAKSLANLNHPNIATLYTLQVEGHEAYMIMELVNGCTLNDLLARVHRLSLRESLAIVAQAVAGLAYAHRRGVIHRDIKPSNLMVTDEGVVKIMDFGIARVLGSQQLTRAGEFYGTLAYASPEQIRSDPIDARADLYSLAIVLYRLLAGTPPFTENSDYGLMTAHLQTPPPPLRERVTNVDPDTETALMRALAKQPQDRFSSVEEFGRAVGAAAIRGEAIEIVQEIYARVIGGSKSDATRIVDLKTVAEREPIGARQYADSGSTKRDPASEKLTPKLSGSRVAVKAALAGAGAAIAVLATGLIFVFWPTAAPDRVPSDASTSVVSPSVRRSDRDPAGSVASTASDLPARSVKETQDVQSTLGPAETSPPSAKPASAGPEAGPRPDAATTEQLARASSSEPVSPASPGDQQPPSPRPSSVAPAPVAIVEPPKPVPPVQNEPSLSPAPANPTDSEATWSAEEKRELQRALHTLGHFQGEPDGDFGQRTRVAIKQFQSFASEPETGTLTTEQGTMLRGMARRLTASLEEPATSPKGLSATMVRGGAQRYARGWSFEKGNGNAHDAAEAVYWYRLAAADGDPRALTNLGTLMARGQGIERPDPEAARLLWWAAATHGEATAMFNLGTMFERGIGVAADPASARKWYERAASRNHPQARAALKRLGG